MAQRKNIGEIIAVSWLLIAITMTILVGPSLGARGILWMSIHHLLCLIGCGHEWIKRRRRQAHILALEAQTLIDTDGK